MAGYPAHLLKSEALAAISAMDSDQFVRASRAVISDDDPPTVRSLHLLKIFASAFGNEDYASALCSQLVAIATIRRIDAAPIEDTFDLIVSSMPQNAIGEAGQDWFRQHRDTFLKLLRMKSVRLVAKSLHLSTDFADLFVRSNIVTDIRPIFDGDRNGITGALITQTLRLHYISGDGASGEQEISLGLDSDDIEKLIGELKKAQKKAEASKKFLQNTLDDNVFAVGEDRYGFR
ncbi:hypothetical protein [Pseudooceanicola sp.]|jgi:hypothetical protein|uniref:hypothetical protein n=1 Tax=Pseudooceanicola sp. TaxID=1914328 RepID=UPI004059B184